METVCTLQYKTNKNVTHKCTLFDRYSVFKVIVIVTITIIQHIDSFMCVL